MKNIEQIIKQSNKSTQNKINQSKYPKADKLYRDTVQSLRKKFKTMDDDQLQQFMKQLKEFCKGY